MYLKFFFYLLPFILYCIFYIYMQTRKTISLLHRYVYIAPRYMQTICWNQYISLNWITSQFILNLSNICIRTSNGSTLIGKKKIYKFRIKYIWWFSSTIEIAYIHITFVEGSYIYEIIIFFFILFFSKKKKLKLKSFYYLYFCKKEYFIGLSAQKS